MALKLNTRYPGRFDPVSTDYPQGKWRNRSSSTANDGGYLEEAHMNDIYGFFGALLRNAEIVPDGTVDTARKSQFYEALIAVAEKVVDEAGYLKKSEIAQEWGDHEDVPLSQKFIKNNLGYVTPEMFGAVGDGIADDTISMKLAFNTGNNVMLSGGRYLISDGLTLHDNQVIIGNNSSIITTIQGMDVLKSDHISLGHTTTTEEASFGGQMLKVDSNDIEEGDLITIVSNISWPHDPRPESTDSRVSELNMVKKITQDGILILELPLNANYENGAEVRYSKSITCNVRDLSINLPYETGKRGRGIVLFRNKTSDIHNVTINGALLTPYFYEDCLNITNRVCIYTGSVTPTSYGGQLWGSRDCLDTGSTWIGNRSGIDYSGSNVITINCRVVDSTVYGGGYIEGSRIPSERGHGTHGASDKCEVVGNTFYNDGSAIVLRGSNHTAKGNSFLGVYATQGVIRIYDFESLKIIDNIQFENGPCESFVKVLSGAVMSNTKRVTEIKGNNTKSDSLVLFTEPYVNIIGLRILNNDLLSGKSGDSHMISSREQMTLRIGCVIEDNICSNINPNHSVDSLDPKISLQNNIRIDAFGSCPISVSSPTSIISDIYYYKGFGNMGREILLNIGDTATAAVVSMNMSNLLKSSSVDSVKGHALFSNGESSQIYYNVELGTIRFNRRTNGKVLVNLTHRLGG